MRIFLASVLLISAVVYGAPSSDRLATKTKRPEITDMQPQHIFSPGAIAIRSDKPYKQLDAWYMKMWKSLISGFYTACEMLPQIVATIAITMLMNKVYTKVDPHAKLVQQTQERHLRFAQQMYGAEGVHS